MIGLWPKCNFTSAEEAAERYEAAYPHEEKDPYLAGYIRDIAAASKRRLPSGA